MSFNDLIRASVVCYVADGILQDSLIKLDAGISTDLLSGLWWTKTANQPQALAQLRMYS